MGLFRSDQPLPLEPCFAAIRGVRNRASLLCLARFPPVRPCRRWATGEAAVRKRLIRSKNLFLRPCPA